MVHCSMSINLSRFLARVPFIVPLCLGGACTVGFTYMAYRSETRDALFDTQVVRAHTALVQQLAQLRRTVVRSSLAFAALLQLDTVLDVNAATKDHHAA